MQCPMRKYVTQKKRKNRQKKRQRAVRRRGTKGRATHGDPCFLVCLAPPPVPSFGSRHTKQPRLLDANTPGPRTAAEPGRNRSFERRASHAPAHPSRHFWPSASRFRAGRPRSICGLGPWFEVSKDDEPALFPFAPLPSVGGKLPGGIRTLILGAAVQI